VVAVAVAVAVTSWMRPMATARSPLVRGARALTATLGIVLVTFIGVAGPVLLVDALVDAL
jgi:hypothetical protein